MTRMTKFSNAHNTTAQNLRAVVNVQGLYPLYKTLRKSKSLKNTVKFLNFRAPENFALIYQKFKQTGFFLKKYANAIANSEDPDQTAPVGAV